MPTLVRMLDQHASMPHRSPLLKPSTDTGLQVAGLQRLAKAPGQKTYECISVPFKVLMYVWQNVEMPGIEPGAFHMQSERSTTELHPHTLYTS